MQTKTKTTSQHNTFCSYCEYTGIVRNPNFEQIGEEPLVPCPRCVLTKCQCNGLPPYFIEKDGMISDCDCRAIRMKINRIKTIYAKSGIDKKYQWRFFNSFEANSKLAANAKNIAYDLVSKFPDVRKGLFLWGNPGTGKTLLSSIILTELIIRHAIEGRFIKISRTFFNKIRATFSEGSATYGTAQEIEYELQNADILVVDDFGVQRDSAWEQETLYNLVDARYEAEKFTLFTSNVDPYRALADIAEGRVLSRIKEMCTIIELTGSDYRENL
ncbi:MAG TPA: ATP-binding protein [Spirochaetota bacterium]|nr:ATP-binding protein [Spirochaetota bacterium]